MGDLFTSTGKRIPTAEEFESRLKDRGITGETATQARAAYKQAVAEARSRPEPETSRPPMSAEEMDQGQMAAGLRELSRFLGDNSRMASEVGATTGVGLGANALAAPLAAAGPLGIAASRLIPGAAVAGTQYGLSRGFGDPVGKSLKDAALAGGAETVAPFVGGALGKGLRGLGSALFGIGAKRANPLVERVAAEIPEMAGDLTQEVAGNAVRSGVAEAERVSRKAYAEAYGRFEALGGTAGFDYDAMAAEAQRRLRDSGLTKEGRRVWKDFLGDLRAIKKGELDEFTLSSADNYASAKKASLRSADGSARHEIGELVGFLEKSMEDAASRASGGPDALAELQMARRQFKDHVAQFREGSLAGVLDDETGKVTTSFIQNASPEEIRRVRGLIPPQAFNAQRGAFFRDKILKSEVADGSDLNIRQLYNSVVSNRKTREQFVAYFDRKGLEWLDDVSRAYAKDKTLAPLLLPNGSLAVPVMGGTGAGFLAGGAEGAALGAVAGAGVTLGARTYAHLLSTPKGRSLLSGIFKAARFGGDASMRGVLQSAGRYVQTHGGTPEIDYRPSSEE